MKLSSVYFSLAIPSPVVQSVFNVLVHDTQSLIVVTVNENCVLLFSYPKSTGTICFQRIVKVLYFIEMSSVCFCLAIAIPLVQCVFNVLVHDTD